MDLTRRDFLAASAAAALSPGLFAGAAETAKPAAAGRKKVAALLTAFHYRSHAHVILENFLEPYYFNGKVVTPPVDVAALYVDQFTASDMARAVAKQYGIPIFPTIAEAVCVGGDKLAVDAVLSIGEHGEYPVNELGQTEYPRKRFFDEAVAVMQRSDRFVPIFNDKHLSYRWDWAKEMYDTAERLGIPFMAGSSVPLAQRVPELEFSAGAEFTEALVIHGGGLESYDFHGLEVLQSFVELRKGGETGISHIEVVAGPALWAAADQGRWSPELAEAAMAAEHAARRVPLRQVISEPPHALLIEYKDGLRGTVLKVGSSAVRWNFACRLKGETAPRATYIYPGPWNNRGLFRALSHAIQDHFVQGRSPYPVERTLLTTGTLASAMESHRAGKPVSTPHLEFSYAPRNYGAFREMGETWMLIREDTPQPPGLKRDGPPH